LRFPNFLWIMFDPTALRVNLREFFLRVGNCSALPIKDYRAAARRALV